MNIYFYERKYSLAIIHIFMLEDTDSGIFEGIFEGSGKGLP